MLKRVCIYYKGEDIPEELNDLAKRYKINMPPGREMPTQISREDDGTVRREGGLYRTCVTLLNDTAEKFAHECEELDLVSRVNISDPPELR